MFGCGIGGLGKKFGFRRHRSPGRKNKHLENFEQLYSERIDYASSCCSDLPRPDDVEMQWTPHPSRGHRHVIKHGLDMEDNASPITVNPHEVTFGNTLGKGASGTVYRGRMASQDVAIKILRQQEDLIKIGTEPLELYMGQRIRHPNLVKVLGVYVGSDSALEGCTDVVEEDMSTYESPSPGVRRTSSSLFSDMAQDLSDGPEEIWIVMEYCNKGSLRDAIKKGEFFEDTDRQRPRILHLLFAALEVSDALEHLHSYGIIHGDLKSQNVMLSSSQILAKNFVCKVGDFGMSRPLTHIKTHISTFTAGTVSHMPPEVLKDGILTPAVDVFSFGMLLWELVAGELPFLGLSSGETMVSIVEGHRPKIPKYCPPMYAELIRRCWHPHREQRPTFKEITAMLKAMLGGPSPAANKGIPAMTHHTATTATSSGDVLFSEGDTVTTTDVTTADLSDTGCFSLRGMFPSANEKQSAETQRQQPEQQQPEPEHSQQQSSQARTIQEAETSDTAAAAAAHTESHIPKPPRVAVSNQSTDKEQEQRQQQQEASQIPARRSKKRTVSFPQWQAYLDAIQASNNAYSKTKIPSCSTPSGASVASNR